MRLVLNPSDGSAVIYGLDIAALGGASDADLTPIRDAINSLATRVANLERNAITRTSYTLTLQPEIDAPAV